MEDNHDKGHVEVKSIESHIDCDENCDDPLIHLYQADEYITKRKNLDEILNVEKYKNHTVEYLLSIEKRDA